MGRTCYWTGRSARRDCHDAHAGRPRPARALTLPHAACPSGSPQRPVNALGYLRVMFAVDEIDEALERLRRSPQGYSNVERMAASTASAIFRILCARQG